MAETLTADCSHEEMQKVVRDQGSLFALNGTDFVVEVNEYNPFSVRLLGVPEGETVPMKITSRATAALLTQWHQAGRFKAS